MTRTFRRSVRRNGMERMQDQKLKKIGSSVSSGIVRKPEKVWQGQMKIKIIPTRRNFLTS